jgi:hypothetical protein
MEILHKGELPSEKQYTARCTSCRTQFRFKKGEAQYHCDPRDGDYLSIRCPLPGCTNTVTVATGYHTQTYTYMDR